MRVDRIQFSLSPRERAGVRGNGAFKPGEDKDFSR